MKKNIFFGYTLIELLVVISISTVLFFLSIASYQTFNKSQALKAGASEVESALREAQNRAISGNKEETSCPTNGDVDGVPNYLLRNWVFEWGSNYLNNNQYQIFGVCYDSHGVAAIPEVEFPNPKKVYSLPNIDNLRFNNTGKLNFNPINLGVSIEGSTANMTNICLINDSGKYYKIIVSRSGEISVEKVTAPATCL